MKTSIKCELCSVDVSKGKCIFAIYERVIDGKEYYFCCERHANEFQRKQRKK